VSPEQIRGDPVDGRTDVYSLGCLLFECLTGEPPFARDQEVTVLYAHLEESPPRVTARRPELPDGIDDVIERALAKKPENRYARAGDLAAAARAVLGGGTGEQAMLSPPIGVRGARRRKPLAWMATGAAVLVGVVVAVLLNRGGGTAVFPTGPNTVAVIDPARNAVTNGVPVGQRPSGIAFGEGAVWAVNFDDQTLSRIDPGSRTELARPGGMGSATGIATGDGAVWVAETFSDTVSVIDPRLNKVNGTVSVPGAYAVAVGGGSVWVTSDTDDAVFRVDPQTEQPSGQPISVGKRPDGIAADDSTVWVTNSLSGTVTRIDAQTGNLVAGQIAVGCQPGQVAIGATAAWVTCPLANTVSKIDPTTNSVVLSADVGASPAGIAVTDGGGVGGVQPGRPGVAAGPPERARAREDPGPGQPRRDRGRERPDLGDRAGRLRPSALALQGDPVERGQATLWSNEKLVTRLETRSKWASAMYGTHGTTLSMRYLSSAAQQTVWASPRMAKH
jgi:YVTN family beta-propeller protein